MKNLCLECARFLNVKEEQADAKSHCSVCLGVFDESLCVQIKAALRKALEPYSKRRQTNRFSRNLSPPSIMLPGDLVYRYKLASSQLEDAADTTTFVNALKQHARTVLDECLASMEDHEHDDDQSARQDAAVPPCIEQEELGYLAFHVVSTPKSHITRPCQWLPNPAKRKSRRRNLDEKSQGGDPRDNLELRLTNEGCRLWSLNQAMKELPTDVFLGEAERKVYDTVSSDESPLDIHVAVWRRPFYIKGCYTKTRRDISQTPFYVHENGTRQKLGASSVEEEILPAVAKACGGVAECNNNPHSKDVVFGLAKLHASGREDMDVRMLLPDPVIVNDDNLRAKITGRPFVCEITDAFSMLTTDDLMGIVRQVNHLTDDDSNLFAPDQRSYGRNPMGVGIADLSLVPSSAFKNLQAETESKVKYYGCLCWSKNTLKSTQDLNARLGVFPVEIHQKTPLRVLHRRANVVRTRHVLSCQAIMIDDHYFRLHLSTDAGTYVKEFVHGDLGRTKPSISTLLECKTDILELDCEGIDSGAL